MTAVHTVIALMRKKGSSCAPARDSDNPEHTPHRRPPRNGPTARTKLARLWETPLTSPLFDGGQNLFCIACACVGKVFTSVWELTIRHSSQQRCKQAHGDPVCTLQPLCSLLRAMLRLLPQHWLRLTSVSRTS